MKMKSFKLFEANIRDNKAIPQSFLDQVDEVAKRVYGTTGPNRNDMMRAGFLFQNIMEIQYGNEEKLTVIGKEIIMEEYGEILDGVELDIKIIRPGDKEQLEMVDKLEQKGKPKEKSKEKLKEQEQEKEYPTLDSEISKAKVLNNILQGEAQNVQNMMYFKKDAVDEIDSKYLEYLVEFFKINKKFDWKEGVNMGDAMGENPDMANMVDIEYENEGEDDEEGEEKPVIKVRALDLQMLIHETVKGVYMLIMAHAISEDAELAQKISDAVNSLDDETEDVKYGPFIASEIHDYIFGLIERKHDHDTKNVKHIKEYIYSKMATLKPDVFIELIYFIINKEMFKADYIMKQNRIVETIIEELKGDVETYDDTYSDGGNYMQKYDDFGDSGYADEEEPEHEVETWETPVSDIVNGPEEDIKLIKKLTDSELYAFLKSKTSAPQRMKIIDQALDNGDYDTVKKVSDFNNNK